MQLSLQKRVYERFLEDLKLKRVRRLPLSFTLVNHRQYSFSLGNFRQFLLSRYDSHYVGLEKLVSDHLVIP